jgi:hypothetical protein
MWVVVAGHKGNILWLVAPKGLFRKLAEPPLRCREGSCAPVPTLSAQLGHGRGPSGLM